MDLIKQLEDSFLNMKAVRLDHEQDRNTSDNLTKIVPFNQLNGTVAASETAIDRKFSITSSTDLIGRIKSAAKYIREIEDHVQEQENRVRELLEQVRTNMETARTQVSTAEQQARDTQSQATRLINAAEERVRLAEQRAEMAENWLRKVAEAIESEFLVEPAHHAARAAG